MAFMKVLLYGAEYMNSYTEPFILLLILFNAIVLVIQSARAVFLDSNQPSPGYFQTWEDYTLFVLFVLYTSDIMFFIIHGQ